MSTLTMKPSFATLLNRADVLILMGLEMEHAFLFIIAAGKGTCLAVLTSDAPNVGVIAYEMAMLVRRMGKYLGAEPRFPEQHEVAAE